MASVDSNGAKLSSANLASAVHRFLVKVVTSREIESAWLSSLSHLEDVAAKQILRSVSSDTPPCFLAEIQSHAADESRHASEFSRMRPIQVFHDAKLLELESQFLRITGSFGMGYFGNSILITAKNRHVAYVHSALTIEQFPFQLYTSYLKLTRLPAVLSALPGVLADEATHLNLGAKMRKEISESERLSIQELNEIEKDMCLKMIERLERVVDAYLVGSKSVLGESGIAVRVNLQDAERTAWTYALGYAEALAMEKVEPLFARYGKSLPPGFEEHKRDEIRHSELLRHSVASMRRKHLKSPGYSEMEGQMMRSLDLYISMVLGSIAQLSDDPDVIYPIGALALEMRVFRHYSELLNASDDILVAHTLGIILSDEAEHTRSANASVRKLPSETAPLVTRAKQLESKFFARLTRQVLRAVDRFEEPHFDEKNETHFEALSVS